MIYLDQKAQSFDYIPPFDVYDRVELKISENASYFYPQEETTGRTLVVSCVWGTEQIAQDIYNKIRGYRYCPYNASSAVLNPAAQLGDAVTVNNVESVLNVIDTTFSSLCSADISAPSDEEIDHEYPYESQANKEINRKVATTAASLTVLADEIESKISSEEAESIIDQKVDELTIGITDRLNDAEAQIEINTEEISQKLSSADASTIISQKLGEIQLGVSSSNGSVSITLKDKDGVVIDSGTTTVNGLLSAARISASNLDAGTINANNITISGTLSAASVYASNLVGGSGGYGGYIPYNVISDQNNELYSLYARLISATTVQGTEVLSQKLILGGGTILQPATITVGNVTKRWEDILNGSTGSAVWG